MKYAEALFGGTFGYIQAAVISFMGIALVWVWQDYKGAKRDVTRLGGEVTALEGAIKAKDGVIASQARSASRRDTDSNNSKDLGNDILKAKDGSHCASSEPIIAVIQGLAHRPVTQDHDLPDLIE